MVGCCREFVLQVHREIIAWMSGMCALPAANFSEIKGRD